MIFQVVKRFSLVNVYHKDKYEKAIDDATVDFADLAEEVMGQDDDDAAIS